MKTVQYKDRTIELKKDGNMWCVGHGDNLRTGTFAFAETKKKAIHKYVHVSGLTFLLDSIALFELFGIKYNL